MAINAARTLLWIAGSGTFDTPSDWIDQTEGNDPALTAPGSLDTAIIAGPAGGAVQVIHGPGTAASLGFSGSTALLGDFTAGKVTLSGTLAVDAGATLAMGSASLAGGALLVDGAGAMLTASGTTVADGMLSMLDGSKAQIRALVLQGGTLLVDATSTMAIGSAGNSAAGLLRIDAGATLTSLGGLIEAELLDNGVLLAQSGETVVLGDLSGTGVLQIDAGATLVVTGSVGAETVAFAAATGALLLNGLTEPFGGVITGFTQGDVIDIIGVTLAGATYTATGTTSGTLALSAAGLPTLSLALQGETAGSVFATAPDGFGGTTVTLAYGTLAANGTQSAGTTVANHYTWLATTGGAWGNAANWADTTTGASPAAIAAGTLDIVAMAGPTGATEQVVTGAGASATLTLTGNTLLSGVFSPGYLYVGSGKVAGTLEIGPTAAMTVIVATVQPGVLEVSGIGGTFLDHGNLTLAPASSLLVVNQGSASSNRLTLNGGTVVVDATATLQVGANAHAPAGGLSVSAAKTVVATGVTIDCPVTNAGTIFLNAGMNVIEGAISGNGTLEIAAGTTLLAGDGMAAGGTLAFAGAAGWLLLGGSANSVGTDITGFATGDAIDILGVALDGAVFTATGTAGGTLALTAGGTTAMSLLFLGNFTGGTFLAGFDGVDSSIVTYAATSQAGGGTLSAGTAGADQYDWLAAGGGDWGTAANWADSTEGQSPATVAPGSHDSVTIAAPSGPGILVVTGQGDSASLAITGPTALAGQFATGALSIGTSIASGTLDIDAGTTLAAASAKLVQGGLQASGGGALLAVAGALTLEAAATMLAGAALTAGSVLLRGGTLSVDGSSSVEIGSAGGAGTGDIPAGDIGVDAGATLASAGGEIVAGGGTLIDDGVLDATGGVTSVLAAISGGGVLRIEAGATLFLPEAVASGVGFTGSTGVLILNPATGSLTAGITGFVAGDAIDVAGVLVTGTNYTQTDPGDGILVLHAAGLAALTLDLSGYYADTVFRVAADRVGGTLVTLVPGAGGALSEGTTAGDEFRWLGPLGGDWGTASNWADSTAGTDPALVAPGSLDSVTISGTVGGAAEIITGQGDTDSLTVVGNIALAGQFSADLLQAQSGTLDVDAGATLAVAAASLAAGGVQVSGAGALLAAADTLTLGPAAVAVLNLGSLQAGMLVLDGGTLTLDAASSAEIGPGGDAAAGELAIDASASLASDGGVIDAGLLDDGVLEAGAGVTSLLGDVGGGGALRIEPGATLAPGGTVGSGDSIVFDGGGILLLGTGAMSGTIDGFAPGAVIDATGLVLSGVSYETGGTLVLSVGGQPARSLNLAGNYTEARFLFGSDGAGGTDVTQAVPCYAAGTSICTPRGDIPVEALRVGDAVVTLPCRGARLKRVVWIGRRRIEVAAHARPLAVCPVRVRRGAFGPGRPRRDLLLSPEHAVHVEGVLMPIHTLLNGATIARAWDVDAVTYVHVELDSHDVLFAEGLPAESFLDTGNRHAFGGAPGPGTDAAARVLRVWAERGCAPLALEGEHVAAMRRLLAARAASLGWRRTGDAAPRLFLGATEIVPAVDRAAHVFRLPAGRGALRLISRNTTPADADAGSTDRRRLGVAVRRIVADGRAIDLTDPALRRGWHDREGDAGGWRWTDGQAELAGIAARRLEISLLPIARYWVDMASAPHRCCGAALAHSAEIVLEEPCRTG